MAFGNKKERSTEPLHEARTLSESEFTRTAFGGIHPF
jgi:hypothetical protein